MSAYYNPQLTALIKDKQLVLDTNVLISCFTNEEYFKTFLNVFENNPFLIDSIVKLEFMRNDYLSDDMKKKNIFLNFDRFYVITEHQDIFKKTIENSYDISRIYSHKGNPRIPLGDILIISRLKQFADRQLFLTLDKSDFSTILFDRIGVVSIERNSRNNHNLLEHIVILQFNSKKYTQCINQLP